MKMHTTFLGGIVIEKDSKYYLFDGKDSVNKRELTPAIMQKLLAKYKNVNVINRPGLCFTFEHLLKKRETHGTELITKDIGDGKKFKLKWTEDEKYTWE